MFSLPDISVTPKNVGLFYSQISRKSTRLKIYYEDPRIPSNLSK